MGETGVDGTMCVWLVCVELCVCVCVCGWDCVCVCVCVDGVTGTGMLMWELQKLWKPDNISNTFLFC